MAPGAFRPFVVLLFAMFFIAGPAFAQSGSGITYQGRILKPNGDPLEGSNVTFRLQIRTPGNENCLMYEEVKALDMSGSKGLFGLTINDGAGTRADSTGLGLDAIFANRGSFTFNASTCSTGSTYNPNADDGRSLVVYFRETPADAWEPMPSMKINYVPFAFEAKQIAGFTANSLVRVADGATLGNVSPLSTANYNALLALIAGTSSQYQQYGKLQGVNLPGSFSNGQVLGWSGGAWSAVDPLAGLPTFARTALPVCNAGEFLRDNGSGLLTCATPATSGGTVTAIVAGAGLTGGTITTTGTIALPVLGAGGTAVKVTYDTYGRITAAGSLVEADIPTLVTAGKVSGNAINTGTIGGNAAVNTTGDLATTGMVSAGSISATGNITSDSLNTKAVRVFETTNNFKVTIVAPGTLAADYTITLPGHGGAPGQVLTTDGAGSLTWSNTAVTGITSLTGDVTASGTGAVSATLSNTGVTSGTYGSSSTVPTFTVDSKGRLTAAGSVTISGTAPGGTAGGDLSGTYPNPTVAKIQGMNVNAGTLGPADTGKVFVWQGAEYQSQWFGVHSLKSSTGVNQFASATCTSSQTLTWSALTDTFTCVDIAGLNASVITSGTLSASVLPIVPVAKGGTNSPTALFNNRIMITSGGAVIEAPALLDGQLLIGQTGGAPIPGTLTAGPGISITNGAGSITISASGAGAALNNGRILVGNASNIATEVVPAGDATLSNTGNVVITANAVTTTKIADDSVTFAKIQNINTSRMLGRSTAGAGDVEEIALGAGLALVNGTLAASGSGTSLQDGRILLGDASNIAQQVVMTGDVTINNAGATVITANAITGAELANNAVTTSKVADQNVTFAKFQNVNTSRILGRSTAGAGVMEEIALGTGLVLSNGTLASSLGAVAGSTLSNARIWVGNGSNAATEVLVSGDATMSNAGALTIVDNAVTTQKINALAVTTAKIADDAVTFAKLQNVNTNRMLGRSSASAGDIEEIILGAGLSLSGGTLAASGSGTALTNSFILVGDAGGLAAQVAMSGDVTINNTGATVITANAITGAELASNAVTTVKIADDNVTFAKIQNVNSGRIAGRSSAGSGDLEEISLGSGLTLSNGTLAATVSSVAGSTLSNARIWVGNGSNAATEVLVSGDVTMSNTGAFTIVDNAVTTQKITALAVTTAKVADDAITFAKLQNINTNRILGRSTAAAGDVEEIQLGGGISLSQGTLGLVVGGGLAITNGTLAATGGGGDFYRDGSVSMTGQLQAIGGSSLAPGYTFGGETNLGMYRAGAGSLAFATNGQQRMVIDANGNVGLGTATPTVPLHLSRDQDAATLMRISNSTAGVSSASGIQLQNDIGSIGSFFAPGSGYSVSHLQNRSVLLSDGTNAAGVSIVAQNATADIKFYTGGLNTTNERLSITSTGAVGIGTATPVAKLDVRGPIFAGAGTTTAGSGGEVRFGELLANGLNYVSFRAPDSLASNATWTLPAADGGAGTVLQTNGAGSLTWVSMGGGGDFFRNGSVSMTGQLQAIGGSSLAPGYTFGGDTDTGLYSGGADSVTLAAGGVQRLHVSSGGNIYIPVGSLGIGTTAPNGKLDVWGRLRVTDPANNSFYIDSQVNGTGNAVITLNGAGTSKTRELQYRDHGTLGWAVGMSDASSSGGGGDEFFIGNTSGGAASRMWFEPTGNIGVGVINPTNKFHVGGVIAAGSQSSTLAGEMRFYDLGVTGNNFVAFRAPADASTSTTYVLPGTDAAGSGYALVSNGAGTLSWQSLGGGGDFFRSGTASMTGNFLAAHGSSLTPGIAFSHDTDTGMYNAGANTLAFSTGGQQRLTIGSTGDIGIGTNLPNGTMEVRRTGDQWTDIRVTNTNAGSNTFAAFMAQSNAGFLEVGIANSTLGGGAFVNNGANTPLFFGTNDSMRMFIANTGEVGIGTTAIYPGARLQTNGGALAVGSIGSGAGNGGQVRLYDLGASGNNYVAFRAPDSIAADQVWTLPATDGGAGTVLQTNGAGSLTWVSMGGGGDFFRNGSVSMTGQFLAIGGSTLAPGISFGGDANTGFTTAGTADNLYVVTGGQERMLFTDLGRIAVGTNSPLAKFHLKDDSVNGSGNSIRIDATRSSGQIVGLTSGAFNATANGGSGNISGVEVAAFLNAGTASWVTGSNVSVGVSGGSATNLIGGYFGHEATSSTANRYGIWIDNVGGTASGGNFGLYQLGGNDTNFFDGRVGVGTSAPLAGNKLEVKGGAIAAGTTGSGAGNGGQVRFYDLGSSGNNYVAFRAPDSIAADVSWTLPASDGGSGYALITNGAGSLAWQSMGGGGDFFRNGSASMTGQLRIISGSTITPGIAFSHETNTGLYLANPNQIGFAVAGKQALRVIGESAGYISNGKAFMEVGSASSPTFSFENDNATGMYRPAAQSIGFTNNNSESMRITAAGSVGIGTTNPIAKLDVNGQAVFGGSNTPISVNETVIIGERPIGDNVASLALAPDPGGTRGFKIDVADDGSSMWFAIYDQVASSHRFRIDNSGNIGMGTNTPLSRLHVVGGAISAGSIGSGAGNAGQVRFYDLAASGTNYVALRSPDNVVNDTIYTLPANSGTVGQVLTLQAANSLAWSAAGGGGDFFRNGSVSMTGQLQAIVGSSLAPSYTFAGDLDTGMFWAGANTLAFSTSGRERMRIDSNGFVGIGTLSPSMPLDVVLANGQYMAAQFKGSPSTSDVVVHLESGTGTGMPTLEFKQPGYTAYQMFVRGSGGHNFYLNPGNDFNSPSADSLVFTGSGQLGLGAGDTPSAGSRLDARGGAISAGSQSSTLGGEVRFHEVGTATGYNYVAFRAPAALAADVTWTLPSSDGGSGNVLSTNGAGSLSWVSAGGGGDFLRNGSLSMTGQLRGIVGGAGTPSYSFDGNLTTGMYLMSPGTIAFTHTGLIMSMSPTAVMGNSVRSFSMNPLSGSTLNATYGFYGDTDTGMYSPGANTLSFATGGVERLTFDQNGNAHLGFVNTSLPSRLNVLDTQTIRSASTWPTLNINSTHVSQAAVIALMRGRGGSLTSAAPAQSDDKLGTIAFRDSSVFSDSVTMESHATQNHSAGNTGGNFVISVTPNGTNSPVARFKIDHTGQTMVGGTIALASTNRLEVLGGAIAVGSIGSGAGNGGQVRFYDIGLSGNNHVAFRAPDNVVNDTLYTLPANSGTVGQVLTLQAANSLAWTTASGGGSSDVRYPASDTTAGASIAIGTLALSGQSLSAAYSNLAIGYQAMSSTAMTTAAVDNVAIGRQVLSNLTTGERNVGIGGNDDYGSYPLQNTTTGSGNVAVGNGAAAKNTTGGNNVAIGDWAMLNGTTGWNNTFVGSGAGLYHQTGSWNSAFGNSALTELSTGSYNTALGPDALKRLGTGNNNLGIGVGAAQYLDTGSNNIFIGFDTGGNSTDGDNNIFIGNSLLTAGSNTDDELNINNTIRGDFTTRSINVGMNTHVNQSGAKFEVRGGAIAAGSQSSTLGGEVRWYEAAGNTGMNYVAFRAPPALTNTMIWTLPASTGTANQLLQVTGTGSLTWATIAGGGDFFRNGSVSMTSNFLAAHGSSLTPGVAFSHDTDTGMFNSGANALGFATGGQQRLLVNSSGNVGIGGTPTYRLDVTGDFNTSAILRVKGNEAIQYVDGTFDGSRSNLFIGLGQTQSSVNTLSADRNLFIGNAAGRVLSDGDMNTGVGYAAGNSVTTGNANTMFGNFAAWRVTTGSHNTVVGPESADELTTGDANVTLGHKTGGNLQSGVENVFLGNLAGGGIGGNAGDMDRNVAIGYGAGYAMRGGTAGNGSNFNILIGYNAADNLTTGDNNIIIGHDIDAESTTISNTLNVGNILFGTGINGSGTTLSTGTLSIGTRAANAGTKFQVNGVIAAGTIGTGAGNGGQLRFYDLAASGTNYVGFRSPDNVVMDGLYTLPASTGSVGQVLTTQAGNSLSWTTISGGGDFFRNGSASMTGNFLAAHGATLTPGIAFSHDTDTGLYSVGANTLGFVTGGQRRMHIDANGRVGIGTTTLNNKFEVYDTGNLQVGINGDNGVDFNIGGGGTGWPKITLNKSGASGLPPANAGLGQIQFSASDSTWSWQHVTKIAGYLEGTATDSSMPTYLRFETTPSSSIISQERMRITSTGNMLIGSSLTMAATNRLEVRGGAIAAGSIGTGAGNGGQIRFYDLAASGVNHVAFRAPDNVINDTLYTLPANSGTVGQVLTLQAANSLSWTTISGGGGDFYRNGSTTMTGQLVSATGSNSLPGITFSGDNDTGFYNSSSNVISVATGGQERVRFTSNGIESIGTGAWELSSGVTAGNPSYAFENDSDTGMYRFGANTLSLSAGGQEVARFQANYVDFPMVASVTQTWPYGAGTYRIYSDQNASASATFAVEAGASGNTRTGEVKMQAGTMTVGTTSSNGGAALQFVTNATTRMVIANGGWVGIGSTAPAAALDVVGDIQYTGVITDVSDSRLKKNVAPLSLALPKLRKVKTYSYIMKDDPDEKPEFGVVAQELQDIFPDLVHSISTSNDYLGVNYIGLIPWTIRALQELDVENQRLKAENKALQDRVMALEKAKDEQQRTIQSIMERLDKLDKK